MKSKAVMAVAAGCAFLAGSVGMAADMRKAGIEKAEKQAVEEHLQLQHAVFEVEHAVSFMEHASHDFGGHRESAVVMCKATVEQLREALRWAHVPEGKVPPWEHPEVHPMRRAMLVLEEAKQHLEHAENHFGGHRECALLLCDGAITQLREALEFEKR